MKTITPLILTALMWLCMIPSYAQRKGACLIMDNDVIPEVQDTTENGILKLTCINEEFNEILQQFRFVEFTRRSIGFCIDESIYRNKSRFRFETVTSKELAKFKKIVRKTFSEQIPFIVTIPENEYCPQAYFRIIDDDFVPTYEILDGDFLKLSCTNQSFNDVLQLFRFRKFWRTNPDEKENIKRFQTFIVETETVTELWELIKIVEENFHTPIPEAFQFAPRSLDICYDPEYDAEYDMLHDIDDDDIDDNVDVGDYLYPVYNDTILPNTRYDILGNPLPNNHNGVIIEKDKKYILVK